jgi:predicted secreted acid phosphatase
MILHRKLTKSVEDLASLSSQTLQAALEASEEREAEQRRGGKDRKRKLAEKHALEIKLKQVKEELRDVSIDGDGSGGEESEEERSAKRMRKPAVAFVASTSARHEAKGPGRVMSKR